MDEAEETLSLRRDTIIADHREFKGFGRETGLTLFEMLDDFIADYTQRGMRDAEIARYSANHLRAFFKDIPIEDLTERKIDVYVKHRLKLGRSRTTVNRE